MTAGLVLAIVPELRDETAEARFDVLGAVTITAGLVALVFGLQLGDDWGWNSPPVITGLVAGAVLIAAAAAVEARQAAPLVDPGLLRQRAFLLPQLVAVAGNFGFGALVLFSTLYLQHVLELPPLRAGVVLLAFSACFVLALPVAGGLTRRLGDRRSMALGMGLMTLAFLMFLPIAPRAGLTWGHRRPGRRGCRPGLRLQRLDHRHHEGRARRARRRGIGHPERRPSGRLDPGGRRDRRGLPDGREPGAARRPSAERGVRSRDRGHGA